jgi:hypothetical protein
MGQWLGQMRTFDSKFSMDSVMWFWCEGAHVTLRSPIIPRKCALTDKWLWMKPVLCGNAGYPMRSGRWVGWTQWVDPKALEEFKLQYYEKYGEYKLQSVEEETTIKLPVRIAPLL